MPVRLQYHFEPQKGWMNDPNGLLYFRGRYHAFFQHYPYAAKWGQMHWGHAISDDLINWTELPIALYPDQPYENTGGCFSGSAIVKDGMLYLFYTSVGEELGQTQSVAISKDGLSFEKCGSNPIIRKAPEDGSGDFRDPKVTVIDGKYYMVCGSGKDGVGKVLLFTSENLLEWDYLGVLFEGAQYGTVMECPDFFKLDDKYVLMFSQMGKVMYSTAFVCGDFDGVKYTPLSVHTPEAGPHFYAPQTFLDAHNRRIVIGWLYSWEKELDEGADYAGALSIPREVRLSNCKITMYPVSEADNLLKSENEMVTVSGDSVSVLTGDSRYSLRYNGPVNRVGIIKDSKTIEVFVNDGEASFTYWFGK